MRDMKERQSGSELGRRGNKEESLRRPSDSMKNVSKSGNIEKEREKSRGSMRRRGRKRKSVKERKRYCMMKMTRMTIQEENGAEVLWRKRGRRGLEKRKMIRSIDRKRKKKLLRPRGRLRRNSCRNRKTR